MLGIIPRIFRITSDPDARHADHPGLGAALRAFEPPGDDRPRERPDGFQERLWFRAAAACADRYCGHARCWVEEAHVTELTGLLREGPGGDQLDGWPASMRVFARRERPHPGAQLSLFETRDGWRYSLWVSNVATGLRGWRAQLGYIDAAHRVHARVEDCIRTGKDCGIGRFPLIIFSPTILRPSELRFCVVDSVVHGASGVPPKAGQDRSALRFPGVSWLVSGSSPPAARRARAGVRRAAGGSLIPGGGCGRWLLPVGAAARRALRAAGPGPAVMPVPAAAGHGVVRPALAGRLGHRARSGRPRRWQRRC
jgi:hypothetical protein